MRSRLILTLLLLFPLALPAQRFLSLERADTLHRARFRTALAAGTVAYGATMVGLYHAWYDDYPLTRFHTFNDLREWRQMDKMGHWLMSYNESRWIYQAARWTGLRDRRAAWVGFAGGQLVQTSFELFDGFSQQWGFSWSDVAFNTLGAGLFLGQQLGWGEQRVVMKMSAWPVRYSGETICAIRPDGSAATTTLGARANELYGTGPVNLFLKNYNTLVVWASVNPRSFARGDDNGGWWPRWLNVAAGLGADNLFEGFGYTWQQEKDCAGPDCITFAVDRARFPRTRQVFLSLDVDLTRLPVKNRLLRTLFAAVNIFKVPAPALEWNSARGLRFYPAYF
jgi:hypothetical protein